jgi:hypothetical protein
MFPSFQNLEVDISTKKLKSVFRLAEESQVSESWAAHKFDHKRQRTVFNFAPRGEVIPLRLPLHSYYQ